MPSALTRSLGLTLLVLAAACSGPAPRGLPADSATGLAGGERARIREFWTVYRSATAERMAQRPAAAADGYARALTLQPDHEDALYYLGSMRLALGDYAGAEQAWRRLVEVNPAGARGHSQLGSLYLCLDAGAPFQPDSAAAHFRLAHRINQEETGPPLHLGEAALIQGNAAVATSWFEAVLGSHIRSAPAHFYLGYLAWTRADTASARRRFAQALADTKAGTAVSAVPSEGDTRGGTNPMVVVRQRCAQLAAIPAELWHGDPDSEMVARYRRLDSLLVSARRRPR
jgi:tetratricopeptide (TPR) repeat protein